MVKIPNRNKSKDNPYTLGYDSVKNTYTVEFIDNKKIIHKIEISETIYKAFDNFELEDVSQIHKYQRHIEHSEVYEDTLNARAINKIMSVEEIVENKIIAEEIKEAIEFLSEVQRKRIKMYFFEGLTQQQIANLEHTSLRAVQYTLNSSINNLKKILKNLKN